MSKGARSQCVVAPTGLSWGTLSFKNENDCNGLKQTKWEVQRWRQGRNASLPRTTKRRITPDLKTKDSQNFQTIKLHGSLTTK